MTQHKPSTNGVGSALRLTQPTPQRFVSIRWEGICVMPAEGVGEGMALSKFRSTGAFERVSSGSSRTFASVAPAGDFARVGVIARFLWGRRNLFPISSLNIQARINTTAPATIIGIIEQLHGRPRPIERVGWVERSDDPTRSLARTALGLRFARPNLRRYHCMSSTAIRVRSARA